ncbi:KR domain-containing protein, partial [archaeon]
RGGGAAAGCEEVWNAKALSAWWLHKHTQDDDLQFFICYSSIVAMIGRSGQSAYGAANAFLDRLMTERRQSGACGLSIRWPAVQGVGMAANHALGSQISLEGWSISLSHFNEVLQYAVSDFGHPPVLTVYPSTITSVPEYRDLHSVFRAATFPKPPSSSPVGTSLNQPESITQNRFWTASEVRQVVQKVVISRLVQKQQVHPDSNLSDFGVDSLSAVDIASNLSKAFDLSLSPIFFFNHPTINKMATQLEKLLGIDETSADQSEASTKDEALSITSEDTASGVLVCIVATACCFPGEVDSLETVADVLHARKVLTSKLPDSSARFKQWSAMKETAKLPSKLYDLSRHGGFLSENILAEFHHSSFKITQAEANHMDVRQRLLLSMSKRAFEDYGLSMSQLEGKRVGVYVACLGALDSKSFCINECSRISPFDATSNSLSVAAGRISFVFGLQGPCMTIDTACSSSLVALHTARRALEHD